MTILALIIGYFIGRARDPEYRKGVAEAWNKLVTHFKDKQ